MHELAVCQALLDQVEAIAVQRDASAVTLIVVRIGPLAGVVAPLLERAFSIAKQGTLATKASLLVEQLPVQVACDRCGARTTVQANRLVCGECGDWRTKVVSGDELVLASVELVTPRPTAEPARC